MKNEQTGFIRRRVWNAYELKVGSDTELLSIPRFHLLRYKSLKMFYVWVTYKINDDHCAEFQFASAFRLRVCGQSTESNKYCSLDETPYLSVLNNSYLMRL